MRLCQTRVGEVTRSDQETGFSGSGGSGKASSGSEDIIITFKTQNKGTLGYCYFDSTCFVLVANMPTEKKLGFFEFLVCKRTIR